MSIRSKCLVLAAFVAALNPAAHSQAWSGILSPTRAIDWTIAGVGGIPARATNCTTIAASACSNGTADCTTTIQNALNACASGQTVSLGSGTFLINSSIKVPANVTLRGAGANQTILNVKGTSGAPVNLGTGGVTSSNVSQSVSITGGNTQGSTSITVSSATNIAVGKYLLITELNDSTYVTIAGGEGNCTWCDAWWSGTRSRGQIVEVTSVSGTTIGIAPALYSAYPNTPLATPFAASAKYAGVENLQVYANNTGYAADFILNGCMYCWLKGVEANYSDGDFVQVHWGYRDEIRDSYFSNAYVHSPGATDSDVFIVDKTSATLVENNIVERSHVSIMFDWGSAGNVVSYNYTHGEFDAGSTNFVIGGISMHGAHPQFNLMEGNVSDQYYPDQVWGSSSHNTSFRNWWEGTTRACNPLSGRGTVSCSGTSGWWPFQASRAVQVGHLSTSFNFVGDVAGGANQNALTSFGNATTHVGILQYPSNRSYDSTNYNMTFGYGESGDDGVSGDGCSGSTVSPCHGTAPYTTALIYKVFTFANSATNCFSNGASSTCSATLPASFYLSAKPAWWGTGPFPAIGPDVTGGPNAGGHVYNIPAQTCYLTTMGGSEGGTNSPLSFNANTCYGSTPGPSAPSSLNSVVN